MSHKYTALPAVGGCGISMGEGAQVCSHRLVYLGSVAFLSFWLQIRKRDSTMLYNFFVAYVQHCFLKLLRELGMKLESLFLCSRHGYFYLGCVQETNIYS